MFEFRVLGALEILSPTGTPVLSVLAQPKRTALLAYLALATPRGFHRRDLLLAWFWPDADEARARRALNQALYHLRRSLGEDVLPSRTAEEVGLDWSKVRCDAVEFRDAIRAGRLEDALQLYRGSMLPGFHAGASPEFEHWLDAERAAARTTAGQAAVELAARAEAAGDLEAAIEWLRRARAIEPEREVHVQRIVALCHAAGDDGAALDEYDRFARWLAAEFDTTPSATLQALAEDLRRHVSEVPAPVQMAAADPITGTAPSPPPSRRTGARWMGAAAAACLAVAVLGAGLNGWLRRPPAEIPEGLDPHSIAVLPFVTLSGDEEYLADGLTVELITSLSQINGLRVPGQTSSFHFKGTTLPIRDVSRQLGVAHVLEGNVRREGEVVHVGVRLTAAPSDRPVWSRTFESKTGSLLELQRRIALEVASTLNFAMPYLPKHATPDPAVQELYLQALMETNVPPQKPGADEAAAQRTRVIQRYRTVLERSPDFAPAHAGLAYVLTREGDFDGAMKQASEALALDSTQTLARIALSTTLGYHLWRWAEADRVLSRGIELAPSSPHLYLARANIRFAMGRIDEAFEDHIRGEQLDPLGVEGMIDRAILLNHAGRWDEALDFVSRLSQTDTVPLARHQMAYALWNTGRGAEASKLYLQLGDSMTALFARGDTAEIRAFMSTADPRVPCVYWAGHKALGQDEQLLDCLEDLVELRFRFVGIVLRRAEVGELRSHPRFQQLLRRVFPDG